MNKLIAILILGTCCYTTCHKDALPANIPACIRQKIDSIKAQPKWNPPAQVEEYLYNGKKVFAFSANCCDQFNPVYDENCNYICSPSGGIAGGGDGKCKDFFTNAKLVRVVWKDAR